MKKTFFRFVTCYGLLHHFLFFLGVFTLFSILYALSIYFCTERSSVRYIIDVLIALMTGDIDKLGYSKLLQSIYLAITSMIVLVWQSVLILKFLNRPDYLKLSDVITYYPLGYHNQSKVESDYLVFRLMNDGYADLYDVEVKVTYRFFDQESQTFQHYGCGVKNNVIPVLSPKMPFRIYIQTGKMRNIRDLYLDPANIHADQAKEEGLDRVIMAQRPQDELIIFVTGYDSQLDQTKSASWHYKMKELKYGEFESIEPIDGVFTDQEIQGKFDKVINGGDWG